jgi:hypothetical protein
VTAKALTGLLRLASNYHAPVRRSIQRAVNREVVDVSAALDRHLGERSADGFRVFMDGYYSRNMREQLQKQCFPIFQAFLKDVRKEASEFFTPLKVDVGGKTVLKLLETEELNELERWMRGYLNGFTNRYCSSSEGQLLSLVEKFNKSPDELLSHLHERLEEWKEKRAEKLASDEIIRSENGMAMQTWIKQGVKKFKWITGPKGHHCPFCSAMNGRVIKSSENFLDSGETLYVKKAEGGIVAASVSASGKKGVEWLFGKENKGGEGWSGLKMFGDKAHPPIHKGCVCRIVPAG